LSVKTKKKWRLLGISIVPKSSPSGAGTGFPSPEVTAGSTPAVAGSAGTAGSTGAASGIAATGAFSFSNYF